MSDYYGPNDRTEVHKVGQGNFGQGVMASQYHHWDDAIEHYEAAIREICAVRQFMEEQRLEAVARIAQIQSHKDSE